MMVEFFFAALFGSFFLAAALIARTNNVHVWALLCCAFFLGYAIARLVDAVLS